MPTRTDDARWMAAALALADRGRGRATPNPNVGCVLVKAGCVVGRGSTQAGGRPHAEAMALTQAQDAARGAAAYVTLEPCAHDSSRGPCCADALIAAGVSRVVAALDDPDPRTSGAGFARLRDAGIAVDIGVLAAEARACTAGWLSQIERKRPFITLKLATSLDGCIAMADGQSRWITGVAARAHGHVERARSDMILVGRGTFDADAPQLTVRLPGFETSGLEGRSPRRALLSTGPAPDGWEMLATPDAVYNLRDVHYVLVEGGAKTAAAFLRAGLVDRLMLYRAPILIGGGMACLADIGLASLTDAHGSWRLHDRRSLGEDVLEVYDRVGQGG